MKRHANIRGSRPGEEGYILVAVVVALSVMMIALAAAVPKVREDIRRDQEVETMRRGQQYVRAIQLYYRKFRHYPPSVDALLSTNNMRFLRQKYPDPLTGKDDWTPVLLGQNKAPLTMGYFGQPLNMGSALAIANSGAGAGGNRILGASPIQAAFNSGSDSSINTGSSSLASNLPASSAVFGGAGIIGFSPASEKEAILVYKTKDHYNEWEFVYDPAGDRVGGVPVPVAPVTPPVNIGAPGFGPSTSIPSRPTAQN